MEAKSGLKSKFEIKKWVWNRTVQALLKLYLLPIPQ